MTGYERTIRPDRVNRRVYARLFAAYRRVYPALRDVKL
jgi:hypothetical protein